MRPYQFVPLDFEDIKPSRSQSFWAVVGSIFYALWTVIVELTKVFIAVVIGFIIIAVEISNVIFSFGGHYASRGGKI